MKSKPQKTTKLSKLEEQNNAAAAGWRERIKAEMGKQRLSQRKLSQMASLGPTSTRHILTQAETVTLETMRRLANALNVPFAQLVAGVTGVVESEEGDTHRRVRLLKIHLPGDDHEKASSAEHGVVPVAIANMPERLYALKVTDTSMEPFGANEPPPSEAIVLKGDIIVWSSDAKPSPGELAVFRLGSGLCCRMLAQAEDGKMQAVPLNSSFVRASVSAGQVVGRVLLVHRDLD